MIMLTACAGQKEFERGYARGSGDTVKRQYWIQQNMQKAEQSKSLPIGSPFTAYQLRPIQTRRSRPSPMKLRSPFTNDAASHEPP